MIGGKFFGRKFYRTDLIGQKVRRTPTKPEMMP
jgi:hypothetical protein